MIPVLIAMAFVIWSTSNAYWPFNPEERYELMLEKQPMTCRTPSLAERAAAGRAPTGKAATYNLDGYYLCERQIFSDDERNSFLNFTTRAAPSLARRHVMRLAELVADRALPAGPWAIEIKSSRPELQHYLHGLYTTELAARLNSVQRAPAGSDSGNRLVVVLHEVDDEDRLLSAAANVDKQRARPL